MTARTLDADFAGQTTTASPRRTAGRVRTSQPSNGSRDAETAPDAADVRTGAREVEQVPGQTELPLIHHQPTLWSL